MTLFVWLCLCAGPLFGGFKLYQGAKEQQRMERVRKAAMLRMSEPKTYYVQF